MKKEKVCGGHFKFDLRGQVMRGLEPRKFRKPLVASQGAQTSNQKIR